MIRRRKVKKAYNKNIRKSGLGFIDSFINDLNIDLNIEEAELKNIPSDGPFIVMANHNAGLFDAILLLKIFLAHREDFKIIGQVNKSNFSPVIDYILAGESADVPLKIEVAQIRSAFTHLENNGALGFFPEDIFKFIPHENDKNFEHVWDNSGIRFLLKAKVPVVPVFFPRSNSKGLRNLKFKIRYPLRTKLIELIHRDSKKISVRIGKPILPGELDDFDDFEKMGRYLRARLYALGSALEVKKFYQSGLLALKMPERIIEPVSKEAMAIEVSHLPDDCLVISKGPFDLYLSTAKQIPNVMNEIGRVREITFREVGEGSNRKLDVDEFDLAYEQLFLWEREKKEIVGAYRLGRGDELISKYGRKGFYISSLFNLDLEFVPILKQTVELGRSFVVKEYQAKPMPLFLLWGGILKFMQSNKQYKYLIGPVSISNNFSTFSKELIISFIRKYHYNYQLAKLVHPKKDFEVKNVSDSELILENNQGNINKLDKFVSDIEPNCYRIPVLLKKYIKQNGQIIGFNIDPKFNNALDGLIILDMEDVPDDTITMLSR